MKIRRAAGADRQSGIRWFDWALFFLLALVCHLLFQEPDIRHTGSAGIAYLNGHILDFYSYNAARIGGCAYMPTTYVLFAIWDIPLRLFGAVTEPTMDVGFWVTFWYTLLPIGLYMGTAYLIFKLARLVGFSVGKARISSYAFATAPIGFYSQFIFGQYDSITMFFVMLGVYYYFKKDTIRFILFFGIAVTCKYFALLIFLPMLLLREKKIWRLIVQAVGVMLPFLVEFLIYHSDRAMRSSVGGFGAVSYIFAVSLDTGYFRISLVPLLWAGLCAWAFFTHAKDDTEEYKWFLYFEGICCFLCFGLSMWHPQWLLLAVPFLVMGTMMHRRSDIFWLLDLVLMLFFVTFVVNFWTLELDQFLMKDGILGGVIGGRLDVGLTMQKIFSKIYNTLDMGLCYTVVSAVLLVSALFKHPKYMLASPAEETPDHTGLLRLRFVGGVAIFLIPAMLCLVSILKSPFPVYSVISDAREAEWVEPFEEGTVFEQNFTADRGTVERLDVKFDTRSTPRNGTITATLTDPETGETLVSVTQDLSALTEYIRHPFTFDPVTVEPGHAYRWALTIDPAEEGFTALYYKPTQEATAGREAYENGEKKDWTWAMETLGR